MWHCNCKQNFRHGTHLNQLHISKLIQVSGIYCQHFFKQPQLRSQQADSFQILYTDIVQIRKITREIFTFPIVEPMIMFETILLILLDISIATVDLMQELTDVDTLTENDEDATALIGALVCYSSR